MVVGSPALAEKLVGAGQDALLVRDLRMQAASDQEIFTTRSRAFPLHRLDHLLRLWQELLEAEGGCLYDYGHRLTLYVLQYDEA